MRFPDIFNVRSSHFKKKHDIPSPSIASHIGGALANEHSLKSVWERLVSLLRKIPNGDVYGQEGVFFTTIAIASLLFWKEAGIKFLFVIPIFRLTRRVGFVPGSIAAVTAAIICSGVDYKLIGPPALYTGLAFNALALLSVALMAHSLNDKLHQVQNQAETDALTGALNRFGFNNAIKSLIEERGQTHEAIVLGVIDLNDFKMLNDVYGHGFGDNILRALKHCLDPAVAEGGFVARLGGDEFVIVFEGLDLEEARTRIQRAHIRFKRSSIVMGQQATFSYGLAAVTTDDIDLDKLLTTADTDMYNSKASAKAVTGFYSNPYSEKGA